jgi:hypothetical protein
MYSEASVVRLPLGSTVIFLLPISSPCRGNRSSDDAKRLQRSESIVRVVALPAPRVGALSCPSKLTSMRGDDGGGCGGHEKAMKDWRREHTSHGDLIEIYFQVGQSQWKVGITQTIMERLRS